jgi:hypothetical protein
VLRECYNLIRTETHRYSLVSNENDIHVPLNNIVENASDVKQIIDIYSGNVNHNLSTISAPELNFNACVSANEYNVISHNLRPIVNIANIISNEENSQRSPVPRLTPKQTDTLKLFTNSRKIYTNIPDDIKIIHSILCNSDNLLLMKSEEELLKKLEEKYINEIIEIDGKQMTISRSINCTPIILENVSNL